MRLYFAVTDENVEEGSDGNRTHSVYIKKKTETLEQHNPET